MMTSETGSRPAVKDLCLFIAAYSAHLLASGATCIRLEKNIDRIASAYGMKADITMMPRHIHLAIADCNCGEMVTAIETVPNTGINFAVNTGLSRLSWEIADGRISFAEAEAKAKEIYGQKQTDQWLTLGLVTLANASFCRLFGGDVAAMVIVGFATLVGYHIKQLLLAKRCDTRLVFIVCAFVSSVLGASDMLFSIGNTPDIAIGTSVLYLVPGIPFLNSFSDLLYRHYLCAFSRFADAVVLTCCLSLGLCAGMTLMNAGMF